MSLPITGVRLVAQDGDQFLATMTQAGQATQQFGQSATTSGGQVSGFGQVVTGALRAVGEFAVQALAQAGAAVVGWVNGAKDAATKYQRTMSDIVGLTGTSAESVKQLSQEVLNLSGQVGIGPQELADALYFVASSGFQGADAMTVLTASAKAAAAGLGDTKVVADLTTSILNAYQMKAGDAAHVTDILTQAVKDGKAEPDQLAGALGRVVPIAAAAGISLEEVAASVASMTRVGLNANESVTALRGLISSLEKPSAGAKDALAAIGYSADELRKSIKDRGLLVTLQEMYLRTHGNLDVLGKIIPNIRALTGVLATTASQGDAYAQTLRNMENAAGATDKAFKQATGTMDFQGKALKSTLEALQIELGEALLPGATAATHALLLFAQSLQGQVGPAVSATITAIGQIAGFIKDNFLPALAGATTALIFYAAANAGTLLPALVEQIAMIAASTTAWIANAVAVLAAAGPFIAVGAAVVAVGVAWNDFNNKVKDATTTLLESRTWWNDSTTAIESYGMAVGSAKDALKPYAATITELRTEIQNEIESLGRRDAAGLVSDDQRQTEMAHINQLREGLTQATQGYNDQEQALLRTSAASMTGTQQLAALQAGITDVGGKAKLTEKDLQDLNKAIDTTFSEGTKAVDGYVNTTVGYMATWAQKNDEHTAKIAELTKARAEAKTTAEVAEIGKRIAAENTAYATQEAAAATAYAKQAAAQKAHLGQMLEDYTLEQVKLGNINSETADKILGKIETTFGQTSDISARTFLGMTTDIDTASREGGAALDDLGEHLGDTATNAVTTKQKMDELAKKYTLELIENTPAAKRNTQEYLDKLAEIPSRVYTEIVTRHTDEYGRRDVAAAPGRAIGGPVLAGMGAYLVGERGPELFVPRENGDIITAEQTAGLLGGRSLDSMMIYAQSVMVQAPMATIITPQTTIITQTNAPSFNLGVTTNQSPAVIQQSFYTARALAGV